MFSKLENNSTTFYSEIVVTMVQVFISFKILFFYGKFFHYLFYIQRQQVFRCFEILCLKEKSQTCLCIRSCVACICAAKPSDSSAWIVFNLGAFTNESSTFKGGLIWRLTWNRPKSLEVGPISPKLFPAIRPCNIILCSKSVCEKYCRMKPHSSNCYMCSALNCWRLREWKMFYELHT